MTTLNPPNPIQSFLGDLCQVDDFHEALQLEEYIALCRKDLQIDIAVSEISLLHTQLGKYQDDMVRYKFDDHYHTDYFNAMLFTY